MSTTSNNDDHAQIPAEYATSRGTNSGSSSKRFKFKSKSKTSKWHDGDNLRHSSELSSRHHHHRHHHRHKRRKLSTSPQVNPPSPENVPASTLHPDIAFRESLFDAMGDDEGAAYWESVYGQPIHTYSDEKRNEETGELEKMSDEEYIAFVRRGMWERSWEGLEAERERRRKEGLREERERVDANRKKKKKKETGESRDRGIEQNGFEREVEESLKRGLERKQKRMWREKWEAYQKAWDDLSQLARSRNTTIDATEEKSVHLRNEIVWPVESGKRNDVNTQEIERFMTMTLGSRMALGELADEESALASTLKSERVRWHPDKVQQRFGGLNIDEGTLRGVTEVFQVMDRLYNERK